MKPILKPLHDYTYSLLRIFTAAMFMIHGTGKILGWPPGGQRPPLASVAGASGLIELVCGGLILIGFLTSIAAFIAAGEMAVAYWMVHAPKGFIPNVNKGEPAVLYCFIFLYIAANGAGLWSIDHLIWGRKATATVVAAEVSA
ncbi:MAG TPA: DoxX family protein [Thermoanaerobaculia bacterium]